MGGLGVLESGVEDAGVLVSFFVGVFFSRFALEELPPCWSGLDGFGGEGDVSHHTEAIKRGSNAAKAMLRRFVEGERIGESGGSRGYIVGWAASSGERAGEAFFGWLS